jgi:hypothetical protein
VYEQDATQQQLFDAESMSAPATTSKTEADA